MFTQAGLILVVIAVTFAVAKWRKLSVEISMLLSALAGIIVFGKDLPFRHVVEGAFTYFDVCLIFITATFFMNILKESGGISYVVRKIVTLFHDKKIICLTLLTFVLLVPGAITGSGAATVLTVGAMVGSVLGIMGISENKTAAIIFLCAAMSAAAPPINIWAMMSAAGSNMPYVGFMLPLLVLTVTGALFSMFYLSRKSKSIELQAALKKLPKPVKGMNGFRVGIPFLTLIALILLSRILPFQMPVFGLPLVFILSSIVGIILSPKKTEGNQDSRKYRKFSASSCRNNDCCRCTDTGYGLHRGKRTDFSRSCYFTFGCSIRNAFLNTSCFRGSTSVCSRTAYWRAAYFTL